MRKNKATPEPNNIGSFSKDDAYQLLTIINTWISSFDSKSSFGLALVGILIGFTFTDSVPSALTRITEVSKLADLNACEVIEALMIVLLYLSSLSSLIYLMLVITARTKNPNTSQSKFFFGSISNFELQNYKDKVSIMTDKDMLSDLEEQIHTNSKICTLKAKYYKKGIQALFVTVLLWFACKIFRLL
jgi:hypothetical protein